MTAARKLASLELTLPIRTVSETNQREHWSARHLRRKGQRFTAWARTFAGLVNAFPVRDVFTPVSWHVTLTRVAPRRLDQDNLAGSFKATIDGIADALGVDDADPRVTWAYEQRRGGRGEYAVLVRIEPR